MKLSAAPGRTARKPGRPPNSDGEVTRERLLDAALGLFARQGFAATTVRQIGAAAGVSDSALYGHFSSKQGAYDALFAEAGPAGVQSLQVDFDVMTAAGPRVALRELVDQVWAEWSGPRARRFLAVVLRDGSGTAGMSGLSAAIETTRDDLQQLFLSWQEHGVIRADLHARQLVWELFAPLQIPRILHLIGEVEDNDVARARQIVDDHVTFFVAAICLDERTA